MQAHSKFETVKYVALDYNRPLCACDINILKTSAIFLKKYFLITLRHFVARRGKPRNIFSDNEGHFTATERE